MLYDATKHEPLDHTPWNQELVLAKIQDILHDTDRGFHEATFWPPHPSDDELESAPMTSLFNGASSTAWALLFFAQTNLAPTYRRDYRATLSRIYETYLQSPELGGVAPGYLFGETGILTVLKSQLPHDRYSAQLDAAIDKTRQRPENELMWGTSGALLAATLLYEKTSEEKYLKKILRLAQALITSWTFDEVLGCYLWTQNLYGKTSQLLGSVHGFAGNVFALLQASKYLSETQQKIILERAAETFLRTALHEGPLTNWQPAPTSTKLLVQWCHGAPGMITCFAPYPANTAADLDKVLLQAGELVWQVGPLRKPFGLCHGTAGNGYPFLKLFQRTQDERWLTRARSFAMHAIRQSDAHHTALGRRRYELFTGDLGLAFYLWACVQGSGDWPLLDFV